MARLALLSLLLVSCTVITIEEAPATKIEEPVAQAEPEPEPVAEPEPIPEPGPILDPGEVAILQEGKIVERYKAASLAEYQYFQRIMPLHLENFIRDNGPATVIWGGPP